MYSSNRTLAADLVALPAVTRVAAVPFDFMERSFTNETKPVEIEIPELTRTVAANTNGWELVHVANILQPLQPNPPPLLFKVKDTKEESIRLVPDDADDTDEPFEHVDVIRE